jgi:3-oxoacyl-[acyl-carrier protein] reductase
MEAFSGVLAAELVPRGITVNVVAPGAIETKMPRDLPKEFQDVLAQRTALGIGKLRDIGGTVAYLAGDGGDWITNEKLRIDGGIRQSCMSDSRIVDPRVACNLNDPAV